MKLSQTVLSELQETVRIELLKRGHLAKIERFEEIEGRNNETRISFNTESFQTTPVIFKSLQINEFSSSISEETQSHDVSGTPTDFTVIKVNLSVNISFENFNGGTNGTEIFTLHAECGKDGNDVLRVWKISIR